MLKSSADLIIIIVAAVFFFLPVTSAFHYNVSDNPESMPNQQT
jgi:hypothetical protein